MSDEPVCLKVVIIESPSPSDLFDGRLEGNILVQSLGLFEIPARLRLAVNLDEFLRALREDVAGLIQEDGCIPIIHLSGHGNDQGFELTDGTFLVWDQLSAVFGAINEAVAGKLVVCLSCCEGISAIHCTFLPTLCLSLRWWGTWQGQRGPRRRLPSLLSIICFGRGDQLKKRWTA